MRSGVLIALGFAASCTGSKSTPDAASGHILTYDFNGTAYAGSLLASAIVQPTGAGGSGLAIMASDRNGNALAIEVVPATPQSTVGTGAFDTLATPPLATFKVSKGSETWTASGSGGSGSVVITALTANEVTGTFAATMVRSGAADGALTSGVFDLTY